MTKLLKWTLIGLPILVLGSFILYKAVTIPDGSTRLAWTAPMENENNEPLNDLAGYKVHCWAAENQYTNTIEVDDPETTSYVIEGLDPGTYNCAVSAIDTDGTVSVLSNVVAKTIR
jgi:hypothetical protein